MADKSTYIKIDRNIIDWRWFKNPKILSVFIWLIIKANIKDYHFEKDTIKRGSLATSNPHIAEGCGLSEQSVRTALANLEQTGEIVRTQRNHYQIITIVNYESYQTGVPKSAGHNDQVGVKKSIEQLTGNQQATNRQLTPIKEYKNDKNGRIEKNKKKSPSPVPPVGDGDVPHGRLKPIDEGTYEDIPVELRDLFPTYADYWGHMNR